MLLVAYFGFFSKSRDTPSTSITFEKQFAEFDKGNKHFPEQMKDIGKIEGLENSKTTVSELTLSRYS